MIHNMTTSEITTALDTLSGEIASARQRVANARASLTDTEAALNSLPASHAGLVQAVAALGNSPFEAVAKDQLSKLTSEFQALRSSVTAALAQI